MSVPLWLAMASAGGVGSVARYVLDTVLTRRIAGVVPWGIGVVNVSGSFALGLLLGAAAPTEVMFVVGTGFLGGYTTFSTWMVQSHGLATSGHRAAAVLNVAGSLIAGALAAWLGWTIGAS